MAAFDKTKSGIPVMDEALQYICLGDNVVWQVPSLDESLVTEAISFRTLLRQVFFILRYLKETALFCTIPSS
ncbi:MAG: hypothetical protein IJT72_05320 [Lachnospiraceae bacterium]|nr:hypothetical protein [Lachnospiraceae bacterium]